MLVTIEKELGEYFQRLHFWNQWVPLIKMHRRMRCLFDFLECGVCLTFISKFAQARCGDAWLPTKDNYRIYKDLWWNFYDSCNFYDQYIISVWRCTRVLLAVNKCLPQPQKWLYRESNVHLVLIWDVFYNHSWLLTSKLHHWGHVNFLFDIYQIINIHNSKAKI